MIQGRRNRSATLLLAAMLAICGGLVPEAGAQTTSKPESGASRQDPGAAAADPALLINPDIAAAAIEIGETTHFKAIRIEPVDRSENSKALVRAVLDNASALEDLHEAIRRNTQLSKALSSRDVSVDDVVSVTTDRDDNAIVFTRR